MTLSLRERQAPLKQRYQTNPESANVTTTVRSTTSGDDPTRCRITTTGGDHETSWDVAAHPFAGGDGELPCSGDLFLGSLAACQEITLRMVAAAMGITLQSVDVTVEGDMDFRGTMGVDPETPVGFQAIRTTIHVTADAPEDRIARLVQRAEKYCVVSATLQQAPELTTSIHVAQPVAV